LPPRADQERPAGRARGLRVQHLAQRPWPPGEHRVVVAEYRLGDDLEGGARAGQRGLRRRWQRG
jgi:hypothetical protein